MAITEEEEAGDIAAPSPDQQDTDAPVSPTTPDQNEQQQSSAAFIHMHLSSRLPMAQRRVWCLLDYPRARPLRCRVPACASDIPPDEAQALLEAFWFSSDDVAQPQPKPVLSRFTVHRLKEEEREAKAARELLMADDRDYEDVSRRPSEEEALMLSVSWGTERAGAASADTDEEEDAYPEPVIGFRRGTPSSASLLSLLLALVTCSGCWTSPWLPPRPGGDEEAQEGEQWPGPSSDCMRPPALRRSLRQSVKASQSDAAAPLHLPLLFGCEEEGIQRLLHPQHHHHSKLPRIPQHCED